MILNRKQLNSIIIFFISLLLLLAIFVDFAFASSITTGFKVDDYGTSFYYEADKYYDNGWHLIDDNNDNIYEYIYFSLTGNILKNTLSPDGYKINEKGYLLINNDIYRVDILNIIENNVLFTNYKQTDEEIINGFIIDYSLVFDKWYIDSTIDLTNKFVLLKENPTTNGLKSLQKQISYYVKEIKKINRWYEDKLYDAKLDNKITKELYNIMQTKVRNSMNSYVDKFSNEWNENFRSIGY